MDIQPKKIILITNNNYSVHLLQGINSLTLKLIINQTNIEDQYQIILKSLKDYQKLQEQFIHFDAFIKYIKDISHLQVDLENKSIKIIEIVERKNKIVEIVTLVLQRKLVRVDYTGQQLLAKATKLCQNTTIQKQQLMQVLKIFSTSINQLYTQKKNNQQQIEHLHKKIQKLQEEMTQIKNQLKQTNKKQHEKKILKFDSLSAIKFGFWSSFFYNQSQSLNLKSFQEVMNKNQQSIQIQFDEEMDDQFAQIQLAKIEENQTYYLKYYDKKSTDTTYYSKYYDKKSTDTKPTEPTKNEYIPSPKKLKKIQPQKWIDSNSKYFRYLLINKNTITATKYVNIFGKNILKGVYSFSAVFKQIQYAVGIGAADILNKYGKKNMNYVWYFSNGYSFVDDKQLLKKSCGFQIGQIVTLIIDMNQGVMEWRVGADVRQRIVYPKLQNKEINWVPFIRLPQYGYSVDIWE